MKTPINIPNLQKSHPFRQWLEWKIPNTDLSIEGYSRASDKTFFFIPQLKICLDASLAEGRRGDYVFISHSHSDHIADIEYLSSTEGVQIYAPKVLENILEDYITTRRQLNHSGTYSKELRDQVYTITGLESEVNISLQKKRQLYNIKTLACDHSVPCLGYAFSMQKSRLTPEFEELKNSLAPADFGKMMASKKKEGVNPTETYLQPLFVYMGDTHASIFGQYNWLWDYPFIITECTYIYSEDLDKANKRRHSHWEQLRPFVLAQPQTTFIFMHFSLRYADTEIIAFFEQEQEKYGFDNVLLWLSDAPLLNQQGQSS